MLGKHVDLVKRIIFPICLWSVLPPLLASFLISTVIYKKYYYQGHVPRKYAKQALYTSHLLSTKHKKCADQGHSVHLYYPATPCIMYNTTETTGRIGIQFNGSAHLHVQILCQVTLIRQGKGILFLVLG